MKFGPNCAISGPCCPLHRLEGLKEAHELFPKLFEPFGINLNKIDATSDTFFTSLLAVLIDFKTQIVVSDLALRSEMIFEADNSHGTGSGSGSGLSIHLENLLGDYYGNSIEIPYLKGKLQQRAVQIRGLLEQREGNLSEILKEKYPIDLFKSNLKNILRNVYIAFPETFLSELVMKNIIEEPPKKKSVSLTVTANTTINGVDGESSPFEIKPVEAKAVDTKFGDAIIKQEPSVTVASATNIPITVPSTESSFKNVIVSGKFFRGILEPVDERFAAIIEGRDVNVKQYLNQRRKKSANGDKITINQAKKENNTIGDLGNQVNKSSLMERHDSAERISWETQKSEEPEIKEGKNQNYRIVNLNSNNSGKLPFQRGRRMFSEQEVLNLIEGMRRFGRDWRRILSTYEFNDRTNVDLKDKARNLEKLGLL